jgi:hypothetical protein
LDPNESLFIRAESETDLLRSDVRHLTAYLYEAAFGRDGTRSSTMRVGSRIPASEPPRPRAHSLRQTPATALSSLLPAADADREMTFCMAADA